MTSKYNFFGCYLLYISFKIGYIIAHKSESWKKQKHPYPF